MQSQFSLQISPALKHSQYFLRHPDFLHVQGFFLLVVDWAFDLCDLPGVLNVGLLTQFSSSILWGGFRWLLLLNEGLCMLGSLFSKSSDSSFQKMYSEIYYYIRGICSLPKHQWLECSDWSSVSINFCSCFTGVSTNIIWLGSSVWLKEPKGERCLGGVEGREIMMGSYSVFSQSSMRGCAFILQLLLGQ